MTTRDAIAGLVRALERIGATGGVERERGCHGCGQGIEYCDVDSALEGTRNECHGRIARAALANWNERELLRDDGEFNAMIHGKMYGLSTNVDRVKICDLIEAALTPIPGTQETR